MERAPLPAQHRWTATRTPRAVESTAAEALMPDDSTLAVLRALARGVDPTTGAVLPEDHACQQGATVRALCAALAELESADGPAPVRRGAPVVGKAGKPWDAEEDSALAQAFDEGITLGALAQRHERSRGAIEARLVRLGKLEAPPGYRYAGGESRGTARTPAPVKGD